MHQLTEIRALRKKHNLNQKELADRSGVSQSLIAKIEAGTVEPTFSKAQQIFAALDQLREKEEIKAKDVMNKRISFAKKNDSIKKIILVMKSKGISQIPVLDKERVVGIVTESIILKATLDNLHKISTLEAQDIMQDAPPIVSPKTGIKILTELLRDYSIVLIAEKGDVKGIVSKADLLSRIE